MSSNLHSDSTKQLPDLQPVCLCETVSFNCTESLQLLVVSFLHKLFTSLCFPIILEKYGFGEERKKISWMDKVSNTNVLRKVNESRNMLNVIWQRKCRRIGHVLRHYGFLQEILAGRMTRKLKRGRRRIQLLNDFIDKKD